MVAMPYEEDKLQGLDEDAGGGDGDRRAGGSPRGGRTRRR